MKNLFKNLMLVAVAAMAFTACTEEQNEVNATKKGSTLTFTADFTNETRTALTDDNNDGVYNAAWEAGDKVIFAAYNGDTLLQVSDEIYIEEEDITNDGASVTLTATFEDVVAAGTTIKGYVNYYYDEYWKTFVSNVNTNWQEAIPGRVANLNASSDAIVWGGGENTLIMFKHDSAYGLMTIEAPKGAKINYVELSLEDFDGNTQSLRLADGDLDANNVFMFCCEPMDVKTFTLVAEDENYEQYNYGKEFEQGTFAFKQGRISKYTINKWYTKLEAPQNVTAELDGTGKNVVFTWEAVENASAYAISVDNTYVKDVNAETLTYTVSLDGRAPFSSVQFEVAAKGTGSYMDSSTSSASFTVPITPSANGDTGFDFEYNQVEKLGNNWYKFSSTKHSYYMTLSFKGDNIENITAGESKVYSTNDGTLNGWNGSGSNESLFTCQYEQSGYEGWFFQGENMVFVEIDPDDVYTITAFCKRDIFIGYDPWTIYPLFKGSWSGTFEEPGVETLATPVITNAFADGNTVSIDWNDVPNADRYKVSYNGTDNVVTESAYVFYDMAVGTHTFEVVAMSDGGYNNSEAATVTVEVEEQGVVEPEVVEFTSVTVEANGGYHILTFTDGTYTAVIKLATRGTTEYVAGTYNQNGSYDDASTLYIGGYVNENTWNGADCWPVTMEVIDNGDDTATFNLVYNEYPSAVQHKGTYTGVLPGLTLVDPEQSGDGEEVPEFVIPGEGVTYDMDYRYTKLVDGLDANNAIRVKQENSWIWDIKFNPGLESIEPGDYKATNSSFSSADALEVDTYNGGFQNAAYNYIYPDEFDKVTTFNVQKEGDYYCITMIGSGGYGNSVGTFRCVYIGKIE